MKTINKDTECLLEDGDVVIVEKGSDKFLCVVRMCVDTSCSSCVLWEEGTDGGIECSSWKSTMKPNGHKYDDAAFVPIEESVE